MFLVLQFESQGSMNSLHLTPIDLVVNSETRPIKACILFCYFHLGFGAQCKVLPAFQRWVPTRDWSGNHLIPGVDPAVWSTENGHRPLPRADFKLPSHHWQWESDWYVDENVDGHLTDKGVRITPVVFLCLSFEKQYI